MNQALKFKNFTDRDFTHSFDGVPYTFKAGEEMYLESFKAEHFAKHLVNRELGIKNIQVDNETERKVLLAQCFPVLEAVVPVTKMIDENVKKTKKSKKVEEEFVDLQ